MDLHYTDSGNGFPVVLIHAFPLDGRMWESAASAVVEAGFRAIVPDLPGFGRSPGHPKISSMDFFASEIEEMLEEEGIRKAVFCGLSMGGYSLLALFRARPDLFEGLVLCDTTADADSPEKRESRAALIDKIEKLGVANLVEDVLPSLISQSTRENGPQLVKRLSGIIMEQPPASVCAALRGMADRPDSKELLGKIGFPVKLIFGAEDAVTGEDAASDLNERIPDADLVFLKDAGHLSNLERPELFNSELISYLSTLNLTH